MATVMCMFMGRGVGRGVMQKKSFHDVTHELVRRVTSPNTTVREQVKLVKYIY